MGKIRYKVKDENNLLKNKQDCTYINAGYEWQSMDYDKVDAIILGRFDGYAIQIDHEYKTVTITGYNEGARRMIDSSGQNIVEVTP